MNPSRAKQTLRSGKTLLGITLSFVDASLAEYLGRLGFECIVVDGEHASLDDSAFENVARACDLTGATPLVRLPVNDPMMQRYLGIGAMGFHVPQVRSAQQARAAVDAIKFAPQGKRGLGSFRAADFGLSLGNWPAFIERANAETLIQVALEDQEGLDALPEILKIAEIDVVLIGTSDLSASLGMPGQTKHPEVTKRVDAAIALIRAAGKVAGLPAANAAEMEAVHARGVRYMLTSVARAMIVGSDEIFGCLARLT